MAPSNASPSSPARPEKLGISPSPASTKRRSRACAKPQIRVLSTDKSNFRNMVQELTGIHPHALTCRPLDQPDPQHAKRRWPPSYTDSYTARIPAPARPPPHAPHIHAPPASPPHHHMHINNAHTPNARLGICNTDIVTPCLALHGMPDDDIIPSIFDCHDVVISNCNGGNIASIFDSWRGMASNGAGIDASSMAKVDVTGSAMGDLGMVDHDFIGSVVGDLGGGIGGFGHNSMDFKSMYSERPEHVGHGPMDAFHDGGAHVNMLSPHVLHVERNIDDLQIMRQVAELESLLMSNDKMEEFGFSTPTNMTTPKWPSHDVHVHTPPPKVFA